MATLLDKMIFENVFTKLTDKDYVVASVNVIKGLKAQLQLLLGLVKNKIQKNSIAYEEQRNKSWKDLSKLMGIKD